MPAVPGKNSAHPLCGQRNRLLPQLPDRRKVARRPRPVAIAARGLAEDSGRPWVSNAGAAVGPPRASLGPCLTLRVISPCLKCLPPPVIWDHNLRLWKFSPPKYDYCAAQESPSAVPRKTKTSRTSIGERRNSRLEQLGRRTRPSGGGTLGRKFPCRFR